MKPITGLAFTILIALCIGYIGARIKSILDERERIRVHAESKEDVTYQGTQMSVETFLVKYAARDQLGDMDYKLLNSSPTNLWLVVYALTGLGGTLVAYWLMLSGVSTASSFPNNVVALVARGLAAIVAGLITWMLVNAGSPWVTKVFSINAVADASKTANAATQSSFGTFNNGLVLAMVAGIFLSLFYTNLRSLITTGSTDTKP